MEESTAAKKGKVDKKEAWTKALVVEKLVAKLESSKISTKVGHEKCICSTPAWRKQIFILQKS